MFPRPSHITSPRDQLKGRNHFLFNSTKQDAVFCRAALLHTLHVTVLRCLDKFTPHPILNGTCYGRAALLSSISHLSHLLTPTSVSSWKQLEYHRSSPPSPNPPPAPAAASYTSADLPRPP